MAVKPFPFPPDLFRSNKHPYSEEIRFITLVVPASTSFPRATPLLINARYFPLPLVVVTSGGIILTEK